MTQLHAQIEQLEQQLIQLIAQAKEQKSRLQKLAQENEQLKHLLHTQSNQVDNSLKTMNQDAKPLLKGKPGAHDSRLLSQYIKIIDDCIAFLEKLK